MCSFLCYTDNSYIPVGVQPHPDFFLFAGELRAIVLFLCTHIDHRRSDRHNRDDNCPDDREHGGYHNHRQARKHDRADHLCQNIRYNYLYDVHHDHTTAHSGSRSGNGQR